MKFVVAGSATAEESGTGGAEAPAEEAAEAPADPTGLTGVVWQWTEFTDPVDGMVPVDNPELYTAEFLTDGSVNVQADCNSGRGNYTADGSNIAISELAMTRALCMPDSLSDDFVNYLGEAAIYFFEETNLFLDLPADSGTMMFAPAEEAVSSEVTRRTAMKVAAQNGDTNLNSENVPSIEICVVVKDDSVTIVTADFPEDQEFAVKMGPLLTSLPMPYEYGPMPYEPMGKPMPYDQGQQMPSGQGMQMPSGQGQQMPSGQGMQMPSGQGQQMPSGQGMQMPSGQGQQMPSGQGMQMPSGPGNEMSYQQGPMQPDMGKPGMDSYYGKPMNQPKSYVPYYIDAGTLISDAGGSIEASFAIPEELAGTYRISIRLTTDHTYPYYAYNWFYNNDASVCNGES
jgi:heat shock protein HslJ